jgi:hypothetical protein
MGSYNEQKEATTNKVRFSINPEGQIEFDAQGLSEWEATEIISQVATQAREQRSAAKKIQEIKAHLRILYALPSLGLCGGAGDGIQFHNFQDNFRSFYPRGSKCPKIVFRSFL